MLYSQAHSNNLESFQIYDRGGSQCAYVFEVAPVPIDPMFGDFWQEAQSWTCASKVDLQLQQTISITKTLRMSRIWRENLFMFDGGVTPNRAIFATVRSILRSIEAFGAESIDLRSMDLKSSNPKHLIAVLRSTYVWRNVVPGWSNAMQVAPGVLQSHGMNSRRELAGLYS